MVGKIVCLLSILVSAVHAARSSTYAPAPAPEASYTALENAKDDADADLTQVINAIEAKFFPGKVSPSPNNTPPVTTGSSSTTSAPPATTTSPPPSSTSTPATFGSCSGSILGAGGNNAADSEIYSVAPGLWAASLGQLITQRDQFQMVKLSNGFVLAAGGLDNTGKPLASAELYNPATGTWSATTPMLNARYSFQMLGGSSALAAGGIINGSPSNLAEVYDPASATWTAISPMLKSRSNFQLVESGGIPLAVGGGSAFSEIYGSGNPPVWTNTAGANGQAGLTLGDRHGFKMVALPFQPVGSTNGYPGGDYIVSGGYDANGNALATTEIYDYQKGTWSATKPMSTARGNLQLVVLADGTVLAAGGATGAEANPTSYLSSAEIYNPLMTVAAWAPTTAMQKIRSSFAMIPIPGCTGVFAAGGVGDPTGGTTSEVYNPAVTPPTWTLSNNNLPDDPTSNLQMVALA